MADGNWEQAVSLLQQSLTAGDSEMLSELLGLCMVMDPQGDWQSGVNRLSSIVSEGEGVDSILPNTRLAIRTLKNRGQYLLALSLTQEAMVRFPEDLKIAQAQIELLLKLRRFGEALEAAGDCSDEYTRLSMSALAFAYLGQQQAANDAIQRAVSIKPLFNVQRSAQDNAIRILVVCGAENFLLKPQLEPSVSFTNQSGHFDARAFWGHPQLSVDLLYLTPAIAENIETWKHRLGDYALVINSIASADTESQSLALLEQLVEAWPGEKVINPPARIPATTRDRSGRLYQGINAVVVPPAQLIAAGEMPNLKYPLLCRPPGTSTGMGLHRCDNEEAFLLVRKSLQGPLYCSEFHDFRDALGYYTKYRVFIINGKIYPEHAVASNHWNVHSSNRLDLMLKDAALREKERRFVEAPQSVLSSVQWDALGEMQRCTELDYLGIDFALLDDNQLLVFEANAEMRINPDYISSFSYLSQPIGRIVQACQQMLLCR